MRRSSVKIISAALAVAVVGMTAFVLTVSCRIERLYPFPVECPCVWMWNPYKDETPWRTWGWVHLNTEDFSVYAPRGSHIRPGRNDEVTTGEIVTPGFTLTYLFGPRVSAGTLPEFASEVRSRQTEVAHRSALITTAWRAGSAEPYVLVFCVPQAVEQDGQWFALEIHGAFRSAADRELAQQMLESVDFPLPLPHLMPQKPAKPPVFDIAPDPA